MKLHLKSHLPRRVTLPTSKSISARALIINALAAEPCELERLSDCDDTEAMLAALAAADDATVDIGAAGTAMRFLTAYFATREGSSHVLTGTERMQERPIRLLVDALQQLGASIEYVGAEGFPPLRIEGRRLEGGRVSIVANVSSQFVSALLMVGPTFQRGLELVLQGEVASRPYIDMTISLMRQFGAEVSVTTTTADETLITVAPTGYHREESFTVEPDWSAASYWYELVALTPDDDAEVTLEGLVEDSVQGDSICARYFEALGVASKFTAAGVRLTRRPVPTGDTRGMTSDAQGLMGGTLMLDFKHCPDLAQTFVVTAALLGRAFHFSGLNSLRIKETDRIAALTTELLKLGYMVYEQPAGHLVYAGEDPLAATSTTIATYSDHRMAMAFAPAAYRFPNLTIEHPEVVSKSYPKFWEDLPLR